MKTGRRIMLKTSFFVNFRNSLRQILLLAVKERFNKFMDNAIGTLEMQVYSESKLITDRMDDLYKLLFTSICVCHSCRKTDRDAVFYNDEVMASFYYPPLKNNELEFRTFWLCPECYRALMVKLDHYRADKYYYLWEYGTFGSLDTYGIEKIEDIEDVIEKDNNY